MSPLPQKKKTPEELAALRKSLGVPDELEGAPGAGPVREESPAEETKLEELKSAVFEPEPEAEVEAEPSEPRAKPVRSLRKSERLPVDQPKPKVSRESGKLPVRRHTDRELSQLRKAAAPAVNEAAAAVRSEYAGRLLLAVSYGGGAILLVLAGLGVLAGRVPPFDLPAEWLTRLVQREDYERIPAGLFLAGGLWLLLWAGWISWKKPRSRHHAGLQVIVAVLVLVFGTLYLWPRLHGA